MKSCKSPFWHSFLGSPRARGCTAFAPRGSPISNEVACQVLRLTLTDKYALRACKCKQLSNLVWRRKAQSPGVRTIFPEVFGAPTYPLRRYHGGAEETSVGAYGRSFAIRLSGLETRTGNLVANRASVLVMRNNALRWVGFGSGCSRRRPESPARFQRTWMPLQGAPLRLTPFGPLGPAVKPRMMGSLYQYTS